MTNQRSVRSMLAGAGLAVVTLLGAGMAQARDVNWSLGISSPGVVLDVDNGRGVRVVPAPVYLVPSPPPPPPPPRVVYYPPPPPPVYYPAPPQPVYYAPAPAYVTPSPNYRGHHRHHNHEHGRGYGHEERRNDWERR